MYGLSKPSYNELIQIVASVPEIDEAIIFGSRARGDYDNTSDIDLSLKGERMDKKALARLNNMLYESHIPYFFDTNIYADIRNQRFKENIDRDGKSLFKRESNQS